MYELFAITLYSFIILAIGLFSYSNNLSANDFIIGNRSLNYWLTALAAHASDMSSWLFMAYPAMIFNYGLSKAWIAVGLILCMYLNWQFIAPKIRLASEKTNSLTFFSYLENRFEDHSGALRIFTGFICLVFYSIYVSAGLVGIGLLIESLFNISYKLAISISILIALPYVFFGGYRTLARIDLFQGLFLILVIVFVPCFLMKQVSGWKGIIHSAHLHNISLSLLPDFSFKGFFQILLILLGWGLGYFGQPAIITKFMGIKNRHEISKSKFVGMSWMLISLVAATLVGLVGIAFFQGHLENSEMIFIDLVKQSFHPFLIGLILCAVFAASINVISSQILVMSTTIAEDIYKKIFRPNAPSTEVIFIARMGIIATAIIAFLIAYVNASSIYSLVLYAWSGLGAAFGPLLIYSLYSKKINKVGAWTAILIGSLSSALWPLIQSRLSLHIDPMVIGFALSFTSIWIINRLNKEKHAQVLHETN